MYGLFDSCTYDMCNTENDTIAHDQRICDIYEQLNTICLNYAQANNLKWSFPSWRSKINFGRGFCGNNLK